MPFVAVQVWMPSKRRLVRTFALLLGMVAVAGVILAPSWRNYYLRRSTVQIVEDLAYVPGPADARHRLDLYLPKTSAPPWPVVVFVHGGFWRPFDRRLFQPMTGLHGCVGVALANRGVATAVLSYRQRPEAASLQDALDDVEHAIRYLVRNIGAHGGDPDRLYIVGHSAGGLFAALLAMEPELLANAGVPPESVRGVAMLAGPYDLERLATFSAPGLAAKVRASAGPDDMERYSPERHVRPGHRPVLLLVGSDEDTPMIAEQRSMAAALRRIGGDVTAVEIPGENHMDLVMHLSRPEDRTLSELLKFIELHH
jgi:acetyl esterase/lipase